MELRGLRVIKEVVRILPLYCVLLLGACHPGIRYPPGGYSYPEHVADKDTGFYLYPLKDTLSKLDSFRHIWDNLVLQEFDEPNMSLRPMKTPEFRFFQPGYGSYDGIIILLTPTSITIKRRRAGDSRVTIDTNAISQLERRLLVFMGRYYGKPRPDSTTWPKWYRTIDSMERLYPQLKDPAYYVRTVKKEFVPNPAFIPYHSSTRTITTYEYQSFVDSLNTSGYWQMPYKKECNETIAVDGPSYFSLEANTSEKYNFVCGYPCPNDTNLFYKACQHLVRLAGLQKEIDLLWIEKTDSVKAPR